MSPTAIKALAGLAALALYGWGAFELGRDVESATWLQAQADQVKRDREAYDDSLRLANRAAAAAIDDARQVRAFAATLQSEMRDAQRPPLAVCSPAAARRAVPVRAGGGAARATAEPAELAPAAEAAAPAGVDPDRVLLTADAVRLWDSALAGVRVPAGACGADGTPADACAAATGYDLDDAWGNHITNASSCAEDRARYRRLIDYLQQTQGSTAP